MQCATQTDVSACALISYHLSAATPAINQYGSHPAPRHHITHAQDWSDQFDEVDVEHRGTLTASQLVTLFSDMGQDLALEDAIVLIKKVNGRRPSSAMAKSHASSVTSVVDSTVEDPDSEWGSKAQQQPRLSAAAPSGSKHAA